MDLDMWQHPATQHNIKSLLSFGHQLIEPAHGELASGMTGKGRMPEPEALHDYLVNFFSHHQSLTGKRALVTAGPTHEPLDPVRFIGNHSSGKMGFAIAETLASRGAVVDLVTGPTILNLQHPCITIHRVQTAEEMYKRCIGIFPASDITVLAAAVADYKPKTRADQKIKKQAEGMTLELVKTHDIAASLGELKQSHQLIIGFALETENEEVNARKKLASKNFDAVVLNSLNEPGAGFGHDTNKITMIDHNDSRVFPLTSKTEAAKNIVDVIEEKLHA
jgi:phosphopantothenoylcysteine decarboxylase/phosphopantothenate--cysteine ligase